MKPKLVTYYRPAQADDDPTKVEYFGDERFTQVTSETTDKHLLDAVRLAKTVNGKPWRDGNGITLDTRYGIELPQTKH